ncbi:hypothetical protein GCM10010275_16050 [Streptomyces litmocidini]|uniref:hypothetical protein n=1 Tax=Streptomyces litmocidini TaxID=67318 RepID=UPI00167F1A4B|nr:hypothetical protein GCM10010275_16050 [Streptomyces litmocidini]
MDAEAAHRQLARAAGTWDEVRLIADGFERVYVESAWCGGPRAGLGDVDGEPHHFQGDDRRPTRWGHRRSSGAVWTTDDRAATSDAGVVSTRRQEAFDGLMSGSRAGPPESNPNSGGGGWPPG